MKVTNQKNVLYVDLSKNIYKGYIETSITRESNEKVIVFKSTHIHIESAFIIGLEKELKVEFFNSKASKQKSGKTGKIAVIIKNTASNIGKETTKDSNHDVSTETYHKQANSLHKLPNDNALALNTSEDGITSDFSFSSKLKEKFLSCFDSFRLRIPDNVNEMNMTIRIIFNPAIENPAVNWYKPVSETDKHREVVACNFYDNASCIFPYVDCITHFDLFYIIPNAEDSKVISSGTFKSIKEEDKSIVYLYSICSHPKYLSFCVGSYIQTDIFSDSDRRRVFSPCCIDTDFTDILIDLQSIIKYIENFTKTKELSTCNIVFSMLNIDNSASKNMVVIKYSNFSSPRDIEMSYYLKKTLCNLLASQVYHFLNFSLYDIWIDIGFTGYLSDYCMRHLLGNNEFLYNYYEDKKFVVENDVVEPPIFYTFRKEFECHSEFFLKKSKLLFHCMESQLSYAFLQKISDEVLDARKIQFDIPECSSYDNEKLPINTEHYSNLKRCFTSSFMTIIKDSTGKDLKNFFDFYLFRPGLMKVKVNFQVNKKKNSVKATMSYIPTSILPKANKKLSIMIDIKSIELEGNFDHSVTNESETVFMYHTRTKKKKKEDEEEVMPLLYIRIDPKRINLFEYVAEQPDYMHIEQLQEKNVIGQLESIESLSLKPTVASCEALERMIDNSHVFYKVRIKAIYALRSTSIEGYDGLQRIAQYFIKNRCVGSSTVLKGNEFGLISYFIQKHLIKCISIVDLRSEKLVKDTKFVLSFYENILKFNDNSLSKFDDSWYIAAVINLFTLHTIILTSTNHLSNDQLSGSDYFNSGFARLIEQNSNPNITVDDFFSSKTTSESKVKSKTILDHSPLLENCMDILERFRIADLVFPSNSNIITRICLISYIRLAYYNKIRISKECLKNLSFYPTLLSIRTVAMEGLILIFSDSMKFLFESLLTDVPVVVSTYLEMLIKVYTLDLRVHFQDTNEFNVKLSERIKNGIDKHMDKVCELYRINFANAKVCEQIRKILCIAEGKIILTSEFQEYNVNRYDPNKEELNRLAILKAPSSAKKLRVSDLNTLRQAAFEANYSIRIPRLKNFKPRPAKELNIRHFKIRIASKHFLVKHTGNFNIRFKILKSKIKVRKSDIPLFLVNKYRENRHSILIDEFVANKKSTGFFPWEAKTSKQILDVVRERNLNSGQTFKEIEKALIFVLSYNTTISKLYLAAKSLYNAMELVFFQNTFIIEKITPLTVDSKAKCQDLLIRLCSDKKFEPFLYPVDTKELKNYVDIVRVPTCLTDIEANLENYQSFEAFIVHLERIYVNCICFNDSRSLIVEYALELKAEIDNFKNSLELESVDSMDAIKNIIYANNVEGLFNPILDNFENISTWGDLDDELAILKKKYTRSSHFGKVVASSTKLIREALKNWFLVENFRVLVVSD